MDLLIILVLINFIKTLFIIVVIYYAIKLFSRYILPSLVDKGIKNMQQKMYDQQRQQQRSTRREGEVIIENNKKDTKNDTRNKGEYVDFEEVD
jgi:hypothetical protein